MDTTFIKYLKNKYSTCKIPGFKIQNKTRSREGWTWEEDDYEFTLIHTESNLPIKTWEGRSHMLPESQGQNGVYNVQIDGLSVIISSFPKEKKIESISNIIKSVEFEPLKGYDWTRALKIEKEFKEFQKKLQDKREKEYRLQKEKEDKKNS